MEILITIIFLPHQSGIPFPLLCWSQILWLTHPYLFLLKQKSISSHLTCKTACRCVFCSQQVWTCFYSSFSIYHWLSLLRHKIASRRLVSLLIWIIFYIFSASNSSVFPFYKWTVSVILRLLLAFVCWLDFCLFTCFTTDTLGFLFSPHI